MLLRQVLVLAAVCAAVACAEDPVATLAHRIEQGALTLPFRAPYGYLPGLLDALHIPVESQIAVFSKTSIQAMRIDPSNPRVIYFNDAVTVGWMQGGFIELSAQDPGNGLNYYVLQQRPDERLTPRDDCVRCHQTGNALVRSVISTPDGIPSVEADVDSRTPFSKLWGGWFVTGASVLAGHMGNAVFTKGERRAITPTLDAKVALIPSSDIVALMVFAHQMRMMNLLTHPDKIHGDKIHGDRVNELVDYLLFVDEDPLLSRVLGGSGFAEKFAAEGPRDHLGRSLRQFDLQRRVMRYPCSYMIYTEAFDALPAVTKEAIYRRMNEVLTGHETGDRYQRLSEADRKAVIGILRDTKLGLPSWFGVGNPSRELSR